MPAATGKKSWKFRCEYSNYASSFAPCVAAPSVLQEPPAQLATYLSDRKAYWGHLLPSIKYHQNQMQADIVDRNDPSVGSYANHVGQRRRYRPEDETLPRPTGPIAAASDQVNRIATATAKGNGGVATVPEFCLTAAQLPETPVPPRAAKVCSMTGRR